MITSTPIHRAFSFRSVPVSSQWVTKLWLACALTAFAALATAHAQFTHPGALNNQADLNRMATKVAAGAQPWKGSWDMLVSNTNGWQNHTPEAVATINAGGSGSDNFIRLARDCARAYQLAVRYHGDGSTWAANKSVQIMNSWATIHTGWSGDTNVSLRGGLYGHQFAIAAELMRGYGGWDPSDFATFQQYMIAKYVPGNKDFLYRKHGTLPEHYWSNWTLANVASLMAIGVLCDDEALFDLGKDYFLGNAVGQYGSGTENINNSVHFRHPNGMGQWQESGRDQGHSLMGPQLTGVICEIAWNQGIDLYGYNNNLFLSSVEYISKYNVGKEVPWMTYFYVHGHPYPGTKLWVQKSISSSGRGQRRPGWDLVYNHYVNRMGHAAPWTAEFARQTRPEGGGFNNGGNSGGFDGLGFTTLTHSRDLIASGAVPGNLVPHVKGRQVTLSWRGSAYALSYNVKRASTIGGPYATLATVAAQNLSYIDSGLTAGTTYYYVVSANNPGGESAGSVAAPATADRQLHGAVIGTEGSWSNAGATKELAFDGSTKNYIDVHATTGAWTGLDLGSGASAVITGVRYFPRSGASSRMVGGKFQGSNTANFSSGVTDLISITTTPPAGQFTDRIVSNGTAFRYLRYIQTQDSGWNTVAEIQFLGQASGLVAPSAPGGLSAAVISSTRIDLSWNAVPGADSYVIKRATTSGGPYVILDSRTDTNFSDSGLSDGTTYHYVVTAINPAGESASSAQVSVTTANIPQFEESGGAVSMEAENGLVGSRWLTPTGSASGGAYIEVDPAYNWTVGSPEGTTAEYLASYKVNISTAGNYRFWFRMLSGNDADDSFYWRINSGDWITENNRYGIGSWFSRDNGQVDALAPGTYTLDISYRENGTRLDKFVIQLDGLTAPSGIGPAESPRSGGIADTTSPDAPVDLVATGEVATVTLDWADSTEADLASYTVYRSTSSEDGFSVIASGLVASAYTDNNVVNGTTYYYMVSATDTSSNESAASDTVAATAAFLVRTWSGPSGGLWNEPTNWSPDTTSPTSADSLTILGPAHMAGDLTIHINNPAAGGSIDFTNTSATSLLNSLSGANQTLTLGSVSVTGVTTGSGAVTIGSSTANQNVAVALGADQTWNVGAGGLAVINPISGSFSLTKNGPGRLILSGANTHSGGTTLSAGVLQITNIGALPNTGTLTLAGGSLVKNASGTSTVNPIHVTGNVYVGTVTANDWNFSGPFTGTGTFRLSNTAADFSGQTTGNASILISGDISGFQGTFSHHNVAGGTTRLRFNYSDSVIDGSQAKFATSGASNTSRALDIADGFAGTFKMGELSGTGGVVTSSFNGSGISTTIFEVGALNTDSSFAGRLANGGSDDPASLVKVGTGTLTLSGANTYVGTTTVSGGTLAFENGSQASPINVHDGASLGFTLEAGTTSTSTVTFDAGSTVKITGAPALASYTLMTASSITGTPVLDAPITGYELVVTGNNTLVLNQIGGSAYHTWASSKSLDGSNNGPAQDPEFDGVPNELEFVLNGNPLASDTNILPVLVPDPTNFIFTFNRLDASKAEIALTFEHGSTLTGWTEVPIPVSSAGAVTVNEAGDPDIITVTIPKGANTKLFGRLKAVR